MSTVDRAETVKRLAKAYTATQASVVDAVVGWALSHPEFDASDVCSEFVTALPRGRKPLASMTADDIAAQIAKLQALLATK
jgi:hypothetical protein